MVQLTQPKGQVSKETNKDSIARKFGCKKSEVIYDITGSPLAGYKVIYEQFAQRSYSLPPNITGTITSLTNGILIYSGGTVDLGALASSRGEFVKLNTTFTTGATLNVKNEVLSDGNNSYTWSGTLPKVVPAASTPDSTGGVGPGAWQFIDLSNILRKDLADSANGKGDTLIAVKIPFAGGVARTQHDKNTDLVSVLDFGAKGDGVTDDTAALQAAITALANGGTLHIPKGIYLTSQVLNLSGKKLHLVGDGINQTVIRASIAMSYLLAAVESSTAYSFNEFRVEGIQFDGNNLAQVGFNLAHRHYCTFKDCAFFNNTDFAHTAKNSWLNNYYNCVFGACPVGVFLQGSNHRNAFYSCSWIGNSTTGLQIIDGTDGNSAITFNNCDWEFQNGPLDVGCIYIASAATFSFNDCYIGENMNGTVLTMDGNGSINVNGGVLFNGVSANSKVFRTSGAGNITVKNAEIIGGTFSSIASLGSQFGSKFSLENCRLGFATLGIQTIVGEGFNKIAYPNPVNSFGKAWTLSTSDGTATQSVTGTARSVTVNTPSSSGLMFLTSPIDTNKLSSGLGPSGRFSRVLITYQSNTAANLYTVNTVGGSPVNSLGALPLSASSKSVAVIAADITGGSIMEIGFSTGAGAVFTLYDVTVLDASDCTNEAATLVNLYKAK